MELLKIVKFTFAVLLMLIVVGCAGKQKAEVRVLWPPLPDEPYMEWLGTFSSQDDFKKTPSEQAVRDFLGQPKLEAFSKPTGIAGDSDRGLVYISDGGVRNVRVYDFNKKTVRFLAEGRLAQFPVGLALDDQNNLYICDAGAGKVLVSSPEGVILRIFGQGVMTKPVHLAINQRLGRVYVTDSVKSEVAVFDMQGEHLFSFGRLGQGVSDLYVPQGIAIDSDNKVYVADQLNARIQVFSAEGEHLSQFGTRGDQFFNFEAPRGLAFDSEDNLWVADARKAAFFVYKKDGQLLLYFAPSKKLRHYPLGLAFPSALMIDQNDRMYLTDSVNLRFQVWQFFSQAYKLEHPFSEEEKQSQIQLLKEKGNAVW